MDNSKISKCFGHALKSICCPYTFTFFFAIIGLTLSGCFPKEDVNAPPAYDEVFSEYPSGASLGPEPGVVVIDDSIVYSTNIPPHPILEGVTPICYRVYDDGDEIQPLTITEYNGFCGAGIVKNYNGGIFFFCNGATTTVNKTLQIWFQWDNDGDITNEQFIANYYLDCVEPPPGSVRYTISGDGSYDGALTGLIHINNGDAIMAPGELKSSPPSEGSGLSLYEPGTATFSATLTTHTYDNTTVLPYRPMDFDTTRRIKAQGSWDSVNELFNISSAVDTAETCQSRGSIDICKLIIVGEEVSILYNIFPNPIDFDNTYVAGTPVIQGSTEFTVNGLIGTPFGNVSSSLQIKLKALAH